MNYTGRELDDILSRHHQAERERFWTAVWGAGAGGFLLACAILAACVIFGAVRFAA